MTYRVCSPSPRRVMLSAFDNDMGRSAAWSWRCFDALPSWEDPLRGIFARKNLDDILASAEDPKYALKRTLGPLNVTLLGIGAIIGAGIFATIGTAAAGDNVRLGAGPSLMLSFVITAVVCAFTALCYAEFASMVP